MHFLFNSRCGFRFSRFLLLPHAAFCPQPISGVRPAHFLCSPLPQRSSIKVSGKEAGHFLQGKLISVEKRNRLKSIASNWFSGLVTNDIGHIADLEEEENDLEIDNELFEPAQPLKKSVYSFFLNTQGRIMFDTIIFRGSTPQEFWIDCDMELAPK